MTRMMKAPFAALLTGALVLPIGASQHFAGWTHTAFATIFRAASANEISVPEKTIRKAIAELQQAAKDERKRAHAADTILEIFRPRFHTRLVTRLVLGKHWKKASKYQQQEFEQLFMRYVAGFYAGAGLLDAFQEGSGVTVTFGQTVMDGKRATVKMTIQEPEIAHKVGFVMRDYNGTWKAIDIRIENISIISAKRSEFGPHITRHGIAPVLDYLRKEVQQYYDQQRLSSPTRT